jgi:hypothetical protein
MPAMTPEQVEAWVDAQSALLGLALAPEHRAGVLRYAQLVAEIAAPLMDFPLAVHDESGSVFVPVPPADGGAGSAA